ncbi:MAG: hypothetical protein R3322_01680 [Kiloniellales bacterium]|nr:hypothetical protein [Kiloniellales bacterium]
MGGVSGVFQSTRTPAFGLADLPNCEREQIHLAGSIEPYGALLVVSDVVAQASENAAAFLDLPGEMPGKSIDDLDGDLRRRIHSRLASPLHNIPIAVRCRLGTPLAAFDWLLHCPVDGDACGISGGWWPAVGPHRVPSLRAAVHSLRGQDHLQTAG